MSSPTGRRRAGLLIPLFSCPSTASWGIGDIGDIEPITAWLAGAGQRVLQLLPLNEMAPGQQSPYSAISAMAIDPIFIRVPRRAGVRRARRRSVAVAGRSRARWRPSARVAAHRARDVRRAEAARAARGVRALSRARVAPRHASAAARCGRSSASRRGGSRTTACFARCTRARASGRGRSGPRRCSAASRRRSIARAASSPTRCCSSSTCSGSPGRSGSRRGSTRTASRCSAICRSWSTATAPTCGCGSISSASTCRSARRPTRSARPDRTGACRSTSGTCSPREDFRWLRERARRSADLFDGYRVDHLVGFYRTYGRVEGRRRGVLHAGRRAGAARARRDGARSVSRRRRGDHRRGSRHRARFRARVARAARRPGLPRVPVGAALARRGTAVPRSVGLPARCRSPPPARTTPSRSPSGGMRRRKTERRQVSELPSIQRLTGGADLAHAPFDPTVRDVLLEALFASASETCCCCRCRTCSAGAIAINEPATVTDENWTYPPAVAGRSARRGPRSARAERSAARVVGASTGASWLMADGYGYEATIDLAISH